MPSINLHHFESASRVNGPGLRAVVWVQGCSIRCPGCFNPGTHDETSGTLVSVDELSEMVLSQAEIEGVTISGGEPFEQIPSVSEFLKIIKTKSTLTVLVFSGLTFEMLQKMPGAEKIIAYTDVLISGPYLASQRLAAGMRGSSNKTIHLLTSRYSLSDIENVPQTEIIISPSGDVIFSGISPVSWES